MNGAEFGDAGRGCAPASRSSEDAYAPWLLDLHQEGAMRRQIQPGVPVRIRDVADVWHPAVAVSGVEGTHELNPETGRRRKVHDFPVVWVDLVGRDRKTHRLPWPAADTETIPE